MAAKNKKVVKKATGRVRGIPVPYFAPSGEKSGMVVLSKEIFGQKPNMALLSQAVRVFLSNQRSARAKTKARAEVDRTKRKLYRQKGTGGARHGARSAPIFVGGGIAHGPRGVENYKLALSKQMRKKALISALSEKVGKAGVVVADIEKVEPKTSKFVKVLSKMGVSSPTIVHTGGHDLIRAGRNVRGVSVIGASDLSAYHVLSGKSLILTKDALASLEERLGGKR